MELVGVNGRLAVGLQSLDFKLHLHTLVLFWLETSFRPFSFWTSLYPLIR